MLESIPPAVVGFAVLLGVVGFIVGYEVQDQTYYRSTALKGRLTMLISAALVVGGLYSATIQQIG